MKVSDILFAWTRALENHVFLSKKRLYVYAFGIAGENKTVGNKRSFEKTEFLNAVESAEETAKLLVNLSCLQKYPNISV